VETGRAETTQQGDDSGERADEPTWRSAPTQHRIIAPTILYFGTPVVLISTCNVDGSANLAPMSSAWALVQAIMLGRERR
jgi:flavin reductase (DIM6/NTAB) family NADH-FMN oxidoreductase RutF